MLAVPPHVEVRLEVPRWQSPLRVLVRLEVPLWRSPSRVLVRLEVPRWRSPSRVLVSLEVPQWWSPLCLLIAHDVPRWHSPSHLVVAAAALPLVACDPSDKLGCTVSLFDRWRSSALLLLTSKCSMMRHASRGSPAFSCPLDSPSFDLEFACSASGASLSHSGIAERRRAMSLGCLLVVSRLSRSSRRRRVFVGISGISARGGNGEVLWARVRRASGLRGVPMMCQLG